MSEPDLSKLSGEMYRAWESSMTQWWDQVLDSPAFLGALGDNVAASARARRTYEDSVDQTMEKLHLPTRKDLVRVARIATMLEDRLLAMEDKLLAVSDQLDRLEKDTLTARVDAAEARVAMAEGLADIKAQLAELTPAAPKKTRSRRKTTASE